MKKSSFKVGDIIRVIRQPQRGRVITTITGLYGFVLMVWPEKDECMVNLYGNGCREDRGSSDVVGFADLEACTDPKWAAYLTPLVSDEVRKRDVPDPVIDGLMADLESPIYREKEVALAAEAEAWEAAHPNEFLPARSIKRNDKGDYLAYSSPECQKVEEMRRGLAYSSMKVTGNRVTLGRANDFLDKASFWSDREVVRNIVRELDLDPYAGRFNRALYTEFKHPRTTTEDLRKKIIKLLNKGHVILDLTPVNEEDSCRYDGDFWHITTGKRKKLPVA